jgi:hypothetical protein
MKTLASFCLALLLAGGLFAQHRSSYGNASGFGNVVFPGTGHAPTKPGVSGFGNVVFPGTPAGPPLNRFSITDPGFARGLGNTVSGRAPYNTQFHNGRRSNYVYVPYAFPVYAGGLYDAGTPQDQAPAAYGQPQQPVVINQYFGAGPAQPVVQEVGPEAPVAESSNIRVYQAPSNNPEDASPSNYYLIAFKDHSIYSAIAYWIDGDTLHYFTAGNNHNQVSMALVDRPLTEQLNRERKVDVRLPKQ